MSFGFSHTIAPRPTTLSVQSHTVADVLSTIALLPRQGGDERHIGINEWVDRVRLSLSEQQLHDTTVTIWGLGIEGLLNVVDTPSVQDDFPAYLALLRDVSPEQLRDTCLRWMIYSVYRRVHQETDVFEAVTAEELLSSRDRFLRYLHDNIQKDMVKSYFDEMVALYFDPQRMHQMAVEMLSYLWESHFCEEWARHDADITDVVRAFGQVDTIGMSTFDAMQVITGRDLRPIFRENELSKFEQIIFVPSKHNGPYVSWFGDDTILYVIFTARMPSPAMMTDDVKPDVNVLIQRFKALSDDNRVTVLLAIREHGELSTQDIIERFDLNKSAASRYLGQLFANGFIQERRDTNGKTKFYSIKDDVIDEFLQSIAKLLKP